ncbi:MAG: hypothetical protein ACMUEM_02645 [Flavobacteriales bacterium AspAUS03]
MKKGVKKNKKAVGQPKREVRSQKIIDLKKSTKNNAVEKSSESRVLKN